MVFAAISLLMGIYRLAPDYDSRIVLTDENKNMAVSYDLWAQLLETALKSRRAEDSLYSYGIREQNAVLLSAFLPPFPC